MKAPLQLLLLLLWLTVSVSESYGQFSVGSTTLTFNDPARTGGFGSGGGSGRQIQCEIYYPAVSAGVDAPVASGTFPVIVFGHGFFMAWDAYENIWDHYAPLGYILVFPRTEGNASPSHEDFGKDLVIVAEKMEALAANSNSTFFNKWNGKTGVMGHSMGGGSTFLAAGDPTSSFDAVVGMAPAETDPSAISAAANVSAPTLVFSGSEDGVTPPADHHSPIYNAVPASVCKQFVSITGGAHCYFANSNWACDFGESTSGGSISVQRAEQQDIVFDLLDPWLSFYLKGVCADWGVFTNLLSTDSRIVGQNNCSYQLPSAPAIAVNGSVLSVTTNLAVQWNLNGNALAGETGASLETTTYGDGSYTVTVTDANGCSATSAPVNMQGGGVGIWEAETVIYDLYPNPATTELTILVNGDVTNEIRLLNAMGQPVETRTITGNTTWNIEQLTAGVYFVQMAGSQKRFVKQ
ncbi:MAG TPA: T9SS type A sorting domain-containing protein [Fluviicola sp.]|nr:T9SS type A sorting domain-containing protein [Fluviicola sp.]